MEKKDEAGPVAGLDTKQNMDEIEKNYAAIEQGCFALLFMSRKMKEMALLVGIAKKGAGAFEATLDNLIAEDLENIRHARKGIGHLIEDVGNFMDGTDMNADMDLRPVELAYSLHQEFPDNVDPKWKPYGAIDPDAPEALPSAPPSSEGSNPPPSLDLEAVISAVLTREGIGRRYCDACEAWDPGCGCEPSVVQRDLQKIIHEIARRLRERGTA
jgi:hypothetical protein